MRSDPNNATLIDTLAKEGWIVPGEGGDWAAATDKLAAEAPHYQELVQEGLRFIKPTFNESMRSGQTNM